MKPYDDNTLMPFGMHKGKKLANVPADYLLHIHSEMEKKAKTKALNSMEIAFRNYVDENYDSIFDEVQEEKHQNRER